MKAIYINPFVKGASDVLTTLIAVAPKLEAVTARPQMFTSKWMNVTCGITGDLQGQVVFSMDEPTANSVASRMLGGMELTQELLTSSLAELGNMISGNSLSQLSASGLVCDITPPSLICGQDIQINTFDVPTVVIPLAIEGVGSLEINLSVKERVAAQAA
ncbi:MAG: chemotaxis protein CheX [Chthonomonas sp.]|nr:chemotaxis protein CheX [Chthonomonas sp.]